MRRRKLPLLPARRRHAPVGGVERHEERRVHHPQAQHLSAVAGKLRIEPHVAAARAVEELAIEQHPRLGEDVLEEQGLAPADVRKDDVGPEALAPELRRAGGDALAAVDRLQDRSIEGIGIFQLGQVVAEELHAAQALLAQHVRPLADSHDLISRLRRVVRGQVPVLAGEVLVNKEESHQTGSRIARLRYEVTGASR